MTSLLLALLVSFAQAAPQKMLLTPRALGQYVQNGVVVGGVAGDAFSIVKIEKLDAGEGRERFVILYGNSHGQAVGKTGYFHVNVDSKLARVSIDLSQVQRTAVDGAQLAKLFAGSKLVSGTEMTMDPIDLSTNIQLNLKRAVEVKAQIENKKGTSALVIELRPAKGEG